MKDTVCHSLEYKEKEKVRKERKEETTEWMKKREGMKEISVSLERREKRNEEK